MKRWYYDDDDDDDDGDKGDNDDAVIANSDVDLYPVTHGDKLFLHCWYDLNNRDMIPDSKGSWGQHESHMGPVGPSWAPCWPHGPCYQGCFSYCFIILFEIYVEETTCTMQPITRTYGYPSTHTSTHNIYTHKYMYVYMHIRRQWRYIHPQRYWYGWWLINQFPSCIRMLRLL